ncbi:hypothetical protein [Sphaerospermopsis sp. FACHB-1194]|nr:hypothetical protein [Sphaerospermopsis sp. FACHB-1194]
MNKEAIKDHKDLGIYKIAFEAAMKIFELSKKFQYLSQKKSIKRGLM